MYDKLDILLEDITMLQQQSRDIVAWEEITEESKRRLKKVVAY